MRCTGTILDIQQIFNIKELGQGSAPLEDFKNMASLATGGGMPKGSEVEKMGMNLCREQLRGEQSNCSSLDLKDP